MKVRILILCLLMGSISCQKLSYTENSGSVDVTIGNLESIHSFSIADADDRSALVMIQERNKITKVYRYNLTVKEIDSIKKLVDKVLSSPYKENIEGLSANEDYFIALKESDTIKYFFNTQASTNRLEQESLKSYLIKTYINSKPMSVFESTNNLVFPPPPPIRARDLDSLKFKS